MLLQEPSVAPIGRTFVRRSFAPETLFLHASNPIWPIKVRIITTDSGGARRVLVTDMSGRLLPVADTLDVDYPVKLLPPDAPFHVRLESRSGDLSLTTSPIPASDGKGGHFVATVLGRGLLAWRDSADTQAKIMADGIGFIRGQRIP
jgi:hypothetical protein